MVSAQVALPEAVTEQGDSIRALFFVVLAIGVIVFIIVEAMILWVVFRYKRKSDDELPTQVAHNTTAEDSLDRYSHRHRGRALQSSPSSSSRTFRPPPTPMKM